MGTPLEKQKEIESYIKYLSNARPYTRRQWEKIIGTLNFVTQMLTEARHIPLPLLFPQFLSMATSRNLKAQIPHHMKKTLQPRLGGNTLLQIEPFLSDRPRVVLWRSHRKKKQCHRNLYQTRHNIGCLQVVSHGHDFGCPLSKIVLPLADTRYTVKTTLFNILLVFYKFYHFSIYN